MFIASAKILEREGSISPSSFYGQVPDYQSHLFSLAYPLDEFSFVEMITLGQSKISSVCFHVWCESGELGGRKTFRGRLTQVVETFSDRVAFRIRSNIPMELLCKKQPTALAPRLFPQKSSTTDFRPDSKCRSDWRCCESVAAGLCTRKWLRLDQTMKNLTSDDLGMRLVVIQLGVT